MTLVRIEGGGRITTEHVLSRERLYREMEAIENRLDSRFGIKGTSMATLVIDPDKNITLRYQRSFGSLKPRRKIGYISITDGDVRIRIEQIANQHGARLGFDPLLVFDDPSLGRPYENSQEAVDAIHKRLNRILSNPH